MMLSTLKRHTWVGFVAPLIVAVAAVSPTIAQRNDATPFPTNTPTVPISAAEAAPAVEIALSMPQTADLPAAVRLDGLSPVYQALNRCSAAALTIQLSYYDWSGTYDDTIRWLNPHPEDVAVRLEEMAEFARLQGFQAIARTGGTLELLKALVAGGFPVLVENVYYEGGGGFRDWLSHNRVIMGYDDAAQTFYAFDSLLGNGEDGRGRPIPYADFDERWKPFNRDYLVIYYPRSEPDLQAILGLHWDETANAEWTLAQSQTEIDENRADGFTYFNLGSSLNTLGRYEEAAAAFDEAIRRGLPWRMMWYQYGPMEAYVQVGRYQDAIQIARDVIATTPGVEETYYYAALAYEGLGETQRAIANLEAAVFRNRNFTEARQALDRLRGTPTAPLPGG